MKTEQFQGPIGLLLQLIERKKLSITDISLASITDEYIQYLEAYAEAFSLDDASQFLFVASTLTLIKSKALLPELVTEEEEEKDIALLKHRLRLYKVFSRAAQELKQHKREAKSFLLPHMRKREVRFAPPPTLEVKDLEKSLLELLQGSQALLKKTKQKKVSLKRVRVHIQDLMQAFHRRIAHAERFSLHTLVQEFLERDHTPVAPQEKKRVYALVAFLAGLELIRKGELEAHQGETFSDIEFFHPQQAQPAPSPDSEL